MVIQMTGLLVTLIYFSHCARSDFPETCGESTYEGPIINDNPTYFDKKCVILTNIDFFKYDTSIFIAEWMSLPDTIEIDDMTFSGQSTIQTIILPKVEKIGSMSFANCKNLVNVYCPLVSEIGTTSFVNSRIKTFDAPLIQKLNASLFDSCAFLEKVNFPNLLEIDIYVFRNCYNLWEFDMSNVIKIDCGCFSGCRQMRKIDLPKVDYLNPKIINMSLLEEVNAPKATKVVLSIVNCDDLKKLLLPSAQMLIIDKIPYSTEEIDLSGMTSNSLEKCLEYHENLRKILIPKIRNLVSLKGCSSLERIEALSASSLSDSAF